MNTAIKLSLIDQAIETSRQTLNNLRIANQAIRDNGYVFFEKINKTQRSKLHECDFEINETSYYVYFDVTSYLNDDNEPDFEIQVIEVMKCHISSGDYGTPLEKIHSNELHQITEKVYEYWNKTMPDNFYDELDENTDCPVNDDTKIY